MRRFPLLKNFLLAITGLWILLSMSSCSTNLKNLIYMQGSFDTAKLSIVNPIEPIIRKGDILSIVVYSDNPEATKIFNQSLIVTGNASVIAPSGDAAVGGAPPPAPGYQVD